MTNGLAKLNWNFQHKKQIKCFMKHVKQIYRTNTHNTVTLIGTKGKIAPFFLCDDNPSKTQPVNCFQSTSGTVPLSGSSWLLKQLMTSKHLKPINHLTSSRKKTLWTMLLPRMRSLRKFQQNLKRGKGVEKKKKVTKKKRKEDNGKKKTRKNLTKENTKAKH